MHATEAMRSKRGIATDAAATMTPLSFFFYYSSAPQILFFFSIHVLKIFFYSFLILFFRWFLLFLAYEHTHTCPLSFFVFVLLFFLFLLYCIQKHLAVIELTTNLLSNPPNCSNASAKTKLLFLYKTLLFIFF